MKHGPLYPSQEKKSTLKHTHYLLIEKAICLMNWSSNKLMWHPIKSKHGFFVCCHLCHLLIHLLKPLMQILTEPDCDMLITPSIRSAEKALALVHDFTRRVE